MLASWMFCAAALHFSRVCAMETVIDHRRPIWNVAHMVNAIYQVDYYLDQGANALEFDITFDSEGTAKYTYHGVPCDCFRSCIRYENIDTFLKYVKRLTTPGDSLFRQGLVFLLMDMKTSHLGPAARARAGADIAKRLKLHYFGTDFDTTTMPRAYVLVSTPSIQHYDFVNTFRMSINADETYLPSRIGFDFSGYETLDEIRNMYEQMNIYKNIWQGDGITNCLPRGTSRLRDAIRRRDQPGVTFIEKVYWWTVDKKSTMRKILRMEVDGMITNYPDRLVSVLEEDEFAGKLRLATYEDIPWTKYPKRTENLITGTHQARGGNFTNEDFMADDEDELLYNC